MFNNVRWRLIAITRKIWVRAVLYSVFGVVAALVSALLGGVVPDSLASNLGAGAVYSILQVMAASMLSVTIFALSTLVGALGSANNASPRATRLLVEDSTAQNILATFLGVFIFSLVGIIALSSGAYGASERFMLFLFTIPLVGVTVASLFRWIHHITQLGRLEDTIDRLVRVSIEAFESHCRAPQLGGASWNPDTDPPDDDAVAILSERPGYVRHLDVDALAHKLEPSQRVWILARPGAFVGPNRPLALISRAESGESIPADDLVALRNAWLVGETRIFDRDPRFCLCVLAEVASKALSAAVNDVGTAIGVLARLAQVLATLDIEGEGDDERACRHEHILVQPIATLDVLRDAFRPIARDGAGAVELGLRLQATLAHIARLSPPGDVLKGCMGAAAAATAYDALCRARVVLGSPADIAELEAAAEHLLSQHGLQTAWSDPERDGDRKTP